MAKQLLVMLGILLPASAYASWEKIEDTFITKPEKELTSFANRALRWSATGLGGIGGYIGAQKLCQLTGISQVPLPKINIPVVPNAAAALSAFATYVCITELYKKSIDKKVIEKFISSWPERKIHTPHELHVLFEPLYQKHKNGATEFQEEAEDTMRAVKSAIYNHFSDKYRDITNKNVSTIKLFNTNVNWDIGSILHALIKLFQIFYKSGPGIAPDNNRPAAGLAAGRR